MCRFPVRVRGICDTMETSGLLYSAQGILEGMQKSNEKWWYYVNTHGCQIGPCETRALSQGIVDGSLSDTSMVRLGPSSWITLVDAMASSDGIWSSTERVKHEMQGVSSPPPKATFFWSYIDKAGHEQGPFATEVMIEWQRSGCFLESTMVRVWPHGWVAANMVSYTFPCVTMARGFSQRDNRDGPEVEIGLMGEWEEVTGHIQGPN